ncbi:hypothetical protein SODALDRAFT_53473 [Sodiomyces alkalinus F11]|uniref:Uncharacterized protein n=1 Tax=Sodiomyces alkalinus (strain CBS 110278 / VKM F-3762 / F11) TaxID=1314773 RepID=A0A3N2PMY8_SODAK|nr:hypothetical protein SODALDRAFT_53473 [Sodiomyces alkalinus F11]ROT35891.1 hypothetical protein SODALDRAFT_53473 [Sodiomyces alkalinus F11]
MSFLSRSGTRFPPSCVPYTLLLLNSLLSLTSALQRKLFSGLSLLHFFSLASYFSVPPDSCLPRHRSGKEAYHLHLLFFSLLQLYLSCGNGLASTLENPEHALSRG